MGVGSIRIWNAEGGEVETIPTLGAAANAAEATADGRILVGLENKQVKLVSSPGK